MTSLHDAADYLLSVRSPHTIKTLKQLYEQGNKKIHFPADRYF